MASDSYGPNIDYSDPFNLEENVREALVEHTQAPNGGPLRPSKIEEDKEIDISLLNMGTSMYAMNQLQRQKEGFTLQKYMAAIDELVTREDENFLYFDTTDSSETQNSDPLTDASNSYGDSSIRLEGIKVTPAGRTFPVGPQKGVRLVMSNDFGVVRSSDLPTPHGGTDISGSGIAGSPVLAFEYSKIYKINAQSGWMGNGIILQSLKSSGLYFVYAHLDRFHAGLSVNRTVDVGDILGYVGNTGESRGAHLHFEVRTDPHMAGVGGHGGKDPYAILQRVLREATIPIDKYFGDQTESEQDKRAPDNEQRSDGHDIFDDKPQRRW